MNRLILVGNGFDLAHNLQTSYCHFISDYLYRAINSFYKENRYDDCLLELKFKHFNQVFLDTKKGIPYSEALSTFRELGANSQFNIKPKSTFLSDTIDRVTKINWVDLEDLYFEKLIQCKGRAGFNHNEVKKLNNEFDYLKCKLEEYLICHQKESKPSVSHDLSKLFCEPIKSEDIATISIESGVPDKIMIVNFNYTSTLNTYKNICNESINTELNHIHGELGSTINPIIFGFGDEYNKNYLEFEELKNKELLKHIKSFGYFRTSNYHNLIRFLDVDNFQVYVFGHSLGLSDRTMLKQIFEHEQCKSIKIFYYQKNEMENDYLDKTYDISSHFSDKGLMRKKIVPFDLSFPMPQV